MISLEDFSELLKVLYATPLAPEHWGTFLDLLAEHTGSKGSYLLVADRLQGLSIRMQGGSLALTDEALATYAAIAPADPYRYPLLETGKLGVIDSDLLVPEEKIVETAMYKLLLEPMGVRHPTTIMVSASVSRMEVVSVWRSRDQGRMPADGIRLLELLTPHVQAVLQVRRKLGAIREQAAGMEAMADASGEPTLLVSAKGKLLHANRAARNLMGEGDSLCVDKGKLRAANTSADADLQGLIRGAVVPEGGITVGAKAMLLQRSSERAALQVMATPLPGPGRVLLVVHDPEQPVVVPEDAMRDLYGMTAAEVEVATGLLTGYSLEEIAALRKVAVGTIRMQLKSIFAKTRTHKQAELVRLLMGLPGAA